MRKLYSAFVSSTSTMSHERSIVIDCLLDMQFFPFCMEHFTISSNYEFKEIEEKIDDSDAFILLLGSEYGSCDEKGVSWTEREYDYALKKGKKIVALICNDLAAIMSDDPSALSVSNQKQLAFCNKIKFTKTVIDDESISKSVRQFLPANILDDFAGWTRNTTAESAKEADSEWERMNQMYYLSGKWYHVHLSVDDPKYIRTGTVEITQEFTPEKFQFLKFDAYNYSTSYNESEDKLVENRLKRSHWFGDYSLLNSGEISGIFRVRRDFVGQFGDRIVDKGIRRGIHDFYLDMSCNDKPQFFHGDFHDEAPSPKSGVIYMFRSAELRLEFLKKEIPDILKENKI